MGNGPSRDDVTEQPQMGEALLPGEACFRALIENSLDGFILSGADGTLLYANPAIYRMSGYSPEELQHANLFEFFHPAEREALRSLLAELLQHPGQPFVVERRLRRKDGSWRWIEATVTNLLADPRVGAIVGAYHDVTERKRAEQALRESEERFRAVFEHSPDAILLIDPATFTILECNDVACRMNGYNREELIGRRADLLNALPVGDNVRAAYVQYLRQKGSFQFEIEHRRKDGSVFPVEVVAAAITVAGRELLLGIDRDITERKQAEQALRESEERFRVMADAAPMLMWVAGPDALCTFVNQVWLDFTGRTLEQELGNRWLESVHPDDYQRCLDTYLTAFQARREFEMEYRVRRADGEYRWLLDRGAPRYQPDGTFAGYIGSAVDITDRKRAGDELRQSQERFSKIFHASPIAICITTLGEGRFLDVNEAGLRMLGYRREEVVGRTAFELQVWAEPERRAELAQQLREQRSIRDIETTYRTKMGEICEALASIELIQLDREACIVILFYDITDRKRAEEALREYSERLKILNELNRSILAAQTAQAIAEAALQHIQRLIPCEGASVTLIDFAAREVIVFARQANGQTAFPPGKHLPLDAFGDTRDILAAFGQDRVQIVEDLLTLPASPMVRAALADGWRSYINAPLRARDGLFGTLNVQARRPGAFTPEQGDIVREVAGSVAVAMQQALLFEQVEAGRNRLQALSHRLLEVQETERRHIARELHDELGQTLTAALIDLQTAQQLLGTTPAALLLAESASTIERTLQQMRDLSVELRPTLLDDLGLIPALRWYLDRQAQRYGFQVRLSADDLDPRPIPDVETICFRVVQEALTNIARHAQARQVDVVLAQLDTEVCLRIHDDGLGFEVAAELERAARGASLGLLGMVERVMLGGGQIDIQSAPGQGTTIQVRFPVKAAAVSAA